MCRPPPDSRPDWRVLEIGAPRASGGLATFLRYWHAWRRTPNRPARLHYVLLLPHAPDNPLLSAQGTHESPHNQLLPELLRQLHTSAPGWQPGFQRLELEDNQVKLTVCIGPLKAMLKAQAFVADRVLVSATDWTEPHTPWDRWAAQSLARLCAPRCEVRLLPAAHASLPLLSNSGFVITRGATQADWRGLYAPTWPIATSRTPKAVGPRRPGTCIVIGAGLAGAATAAALANRGWQVQVAAGEREPGAGDSSASGGLPLALFCPAESKHDAPLSRLVRAGIGLLAQRLPVLLPFSEAWAMPGISETLFDRGPNADSRGQAFGHHWHTHAGWVKPASLLAALLATPRVEHVSSMAVQRLAQHGNMWQVLGADNTLLASAQVVVVATGGASAALLSTVAPASSTSTSPQRLGKTPGDRLQSVHPVAGQMSWAEQLDEEGHQLPGHPVNGHGHLSAHIPCRSGKAWYLGATYEPGFSAAPGASTSEAADIEHHTQSAHQQNLGKLRQLAPEHAKLLAPRFERGEVKAWRGTRYATRDRLPVLGPWLAHAYEGLWVNTGLGSRGLSWCLLNAELIAAQLNGEPLPVDAKLAAALLP